MISIRSKFPFDIQKVSIVIFLESFNCNFFIVNARREAMAESRKSLKKSSLFQNIMNRSVIGKPKYPMDVCYVTIFSFLSSISKGIIKEFFSGKLDGGHCRLDDARAHDTYKAADCEGLAEMQRIVDLINAQSSPGIPRSAKNLIVNESRLTASEEKESITKKDLVERAYWIFTMKGTSKEINAILANFNKPGIYSARGFGERILSAEDSSGRFHYTRSDYFNEFENKSDSPSRRL